MSWGEEYQRKRRVRSIWRGYYETRAQYPFPTLGSNRIENRQAVRQFCLLLTTDEEVDYFIHLLGTGRAPHVPNRRRRAA